MPLPEENAPFPSEEWKPAFEQFAVNNAWYTGDVQALASFGDGNATTATRGDDPTTHVHKGQGYTGGLLGWWKRRFIGNPFWGRPVPADQTRTRVHSLVAGNFAGLNSDILFAEPSNTRLMDDGKAVRGPAQKRMDLIANGASTQMAYAEGAEFAAGLGAAVLRAEWDRETSDFPTTGVIACDAAIPEWTGSRTSALNLWSTHHATTAAGLDSGRYTHLERHEIGRIVHALYFAGVGEESIGRLVPVAEWANRLEAVAHVPEVPGSFIEGDTVVMLTGIEFLTAQYWRNRRTRLFRSMGTLTRIGRSDLEGAETTLSMIDETLSSWMRDIKVARARLMVPAAYLEQSRAGGGAAWDDDAEIMTALEFIGDLGGDKGETISAHQFAIRADEHQKSILAFTRELLQHAGYSPSSYGDTGEGNSATATEVTDRTSQTERTRNKKALYFKQAVIPLDRALMELDRVHYGGPGLPAGAEVDVQFAELSQIDPEKLARTLAQLRAAEAATTKTLVRMQHPDWDDLELDAEVETIYLETGRGADDVDPGTEGRVDPEADLAEREARRVAGEVDDPDEIDDDQQAAA